VPEELEDFERSTSELVERIGAEDTRAVKKVRIAMSAYIVRDRVDIS